MKQMIRALSSQFHNFLLLGGAGSGKSECAANLAFRLVEGANRPVHFFDLDMTKPLFRSRDLAERMEAAGISFHCQQQFMDAPTQVGGVSRLLRDERVCTVLDVGGDHIGARAVGGYADLLNSPRTAVFYVLNAYRPWSASLKEIDETLGRILGVSHIALDRLQLVSNPNMGPQTSPTEFLEGCRLIREEVGGCRPIALTCVREELLDDVAPLADTPLFPLHIYFSEPWLGVRATQKEGA